MATDITYPLASTPASHYTGALSQNEAEEEEFPGLAGDGKGYIRELSIWSKEKLSWQIEIWDTDDNIIQSQSFSDTSATESTIDSTTYYFYHANIEWVIPLSYHKRTVSVALRNLSATNKTAGTNGAVTIKISIKK